MPYLIILLSLVFYSQIVSAQTNPIAMYNFNGCGLTDVTGNYDDAVIRNSLDCDCGVGDNSQAYYFDGTADTMFLDNELNQIFSENFSVGFHFWVDNAADAYSLMSIREQCTRDSSFIIQYLPSSNEIIVEFSRNIAEGVFFRAELDPNICWHHIMFTKQDEIFALYIDGEFVVSDEFLTLIEVGRNFDFAVGYSPCVGITDQFFTGRIDEIVFFDYALKAEEIQSRFEFPDKLVSQDTTIFLGDQVQVASTNSCASNITWSPSIGVDDPFVSNPLITPDMTTLYQVEFDHGTCRSIDSLLISVIDEDEISCADLLLPSAFTPNNDGINDFYGISNRFIIEDLQRFEIYNRWGMMLFQGIDKNDRWDGRYEGEFQGPGTYIYKVEYNCLGEHYSKAGSFNIMR